MLRGGDGPRLYPLARAPRAVRRYRDDRARLQGADDTQQSDLTAALRGATHRLVAPSVREIGQVLAVAVPADEQHQPFALVQREQREEPRMPEHEDEWRLPGLPAALAKAPRRRERLDRGRPHRLRDRLRPPQLHRIRPAASSATRSAAPGAPRRSRTSCNPSRWRRVTGFAASSSGNTPSASVSAFARPCRNSGATSYPATRLTRPTHGTWTRRNAMNDEIGCTRYVITIGRSAIAASSVVVPDLQIPASAAANTSSGSPRCTLMLPGSGYSAPAVPATMICRSRRTAATRAAAVRNIVQCRFTSCSRLPGNRPSVCRPGSSPSIRRASARGGGGGRSFRGCPTNVAATPRSRKNFSSNGRMTAS